MLKSVTVTESMAASATPAQLQQFSNAAAEEIGETKVDLEECVKKLKELVIRNHEDLRLPPDIDNFLERCLRCRKFDLERSAKQVYAYFKYLADLYKMHDDMFFVPSMHRQVSYDSGAVTVLKNRDSKGRQIIFVSFEMLKPETFCIDKALAATVLIIDELTRVSVDTQRLGTVFVCDFKGYSFGHAKQFTLSKLRACVRMIQGGFPMRFKGFHIVRTPAIFTYLFAMVRPLLGEKIKSRVQVYGHNLEEFHAQISPEILPDCVGGKLSNEECFDKQFIEQLCNRDEYYRNLFKYGYMSF